MSHPALLLTGISQLVTPRGDGRLHGRAMGELDIIPDAAIGISSGRITWVGPARDAPTGAPRAIDLGGKAVVPGLVDPHTHAVWGGDRLADFDARVRGVPYEEILAGGGGIWSTIRSTVATAPETLIATGLARTAALLRSGATTIEVKSGYGFTPQSEHELLNFIRAIDAASPAAIMPTLLIHVPPPDPTAREGYLAEMIRWLIPAVGLGRLARAVDIFIEREAFTVAEAREIFTAARNAGLAVRAHADQFHAIGGVELAIECGARSVDHLEASGPAQVAALAASATVAVVLPGVTLHLGLPPAPGRALIDAGAAVAVGTDLNPGSSPLFSTQLALALSVRLNGLTPAEALTAATANAAAVLGLTDRGRLQPQRRADLLVLASRDWRDIAYGLGGNPVERVFIAGEEVTT